METVTEKQNLKHLQSMNITQTINGDQARNKKKQFYPKNVGPPDLTFFLLSFSSFCPLRLVTHSTRTPLAPTVLNVMMEILKYVKKC